MNIDPYGKIGHIGMISSPQKNNANNNTMAKSTPIKDQLSFTSRAKEQQDQKPFGTRMANWLGSLLTLQFLKNDKKNQTDNVAATSGLKVENPFSGQGNTFVF